MRPAAALLSILLAAATPAVAQTSAQSGMGGLLSQLGGKSAGGAGLLGGLSGVGSAGANNITGLLGYCVKNQLLGGATATTATKGTASTSAASGLLGKLTGKQGVTQSQGFLAGSQGVLQTGGTNLPLNSLGDGVKQQVCRTVLSRAQGLLGR